MPKAQKTVASKTRPQLKKSAKGKPAAAKKAEPARSQKGGAPAFRWNEEYESGGYATNWHISFPSQELVAAVGALGLVPGSVALDVGCGAGTEIIYLAKCGFQAIGVDLAPKALEIAREAAIAAGAAVEFKEGSALRLPIGPESVDFVNDRGCFHH